MRSLLLTILLLLSTIVLGVVTIMQFQEGSLKRFLGTPPIPIGEKIYPDFVPEKVSTITVKSADLIAEFSITEKGWQATTPWQDRMDARAALAILTFANTATAQGSILRDDLNLSAAGFGNTAVDINLRNSAGESLAHFRLGRRTPWMGLTQGDSPQALPTTYLLPLERGRRTHVYAATGDLLPLFKDRFSFFRDHRPFYFNPLRLQKIRIRTSQGELTLGREDPGASWRIVKPLELPTNPESMKLLLDGLYELTAFKATDRAEATLQPDDVSAEHDQIALTSFGSEQEVVLEIMPPESPESRETQATVSDRPNTLFTLPLKTEPELVSISDLPLTVNDLRDPTLTNLNIASVRGIAIQTATTPLILLSWKRPAPWIATINGTEQLANEQRIFDLLKAVTETRATAFETDAAPEDLSPWGLDRPILSLSFLAANNQKLSIRFGLDRSGNLFAKREDKATIMRLDNSFLSQIAVNPHEWRHARVWSLNRVDLKEIVRTEDGQESLKLGYDSFDESWSATSAGKDVTGNLDPAYANFLLGALENLQATRWLSSNDETAKRVLEKPALTYSIKQNVVDDFGDKIGSIDYTLALSPDPTTRQIYAKLSSDPSYFIISPETYLKLQIPLLDQ